MNKNFLIKSSKQFQEITVNENSSPIERLLGYELLASEIDQFYFQFIVELTEEEQQILNKKFIIADFYFPWLNLIIECDGKQHYDKNNNDKRRDSILLSKGIKTVRLDGNEIFGNFSVIAGILGNVSESIKQNI